jgi:hypothetical protein
MKTPPERVSIIAKARAQGHAAVAADALMPIDYMLSVIRDPKATQLRRDRMAIAAAPYCHPRATEAPLGKKQQAQINAVEGVKGTEWVELVH